jgi:hypothetical protein
MLNHDIELVREQQNKMATLFKFDGGSTEVKPENGHGFLHYQHSHLVW